MTKKTFRKKKVKKGHSQTLANKLLVKTTYFPVSLPDPVENPPLGTFNLRVSFGFAACTLPARASPSPTFPFASPRADRSPLRVEPLLLALTLRLAFVVLLALEAEGFLGGLRRVRGTGGGMELRVEELAWLWLLAVLSRRLSEGG